MSKRCPKVFFLYNKKSISNKCSPVRAREWLITTCTPVASSRRLVAVRTRACGACTCKFVQDMTGHRKTGTKITVFHGFS